MKHYPTNLRLVLAALFAVCLGMSAWAGLKAFTNTFSANAPAEPAPVAAQVAAPAKVKAAAPSVDYTANGNYRLFWQEDDATKVSDDFALNNDNVWGFYRYDVATGSYEKFANFDGNSVKAKAENGDTWYTNDEYCFVSVTGNSHASTSASPAIVFTAPADGIYYATFTARRNSPNNYVLFLRSRLLEPTGMQCDKTESMFVKPYGVTTVDNADGKQPQTLDFFVRLSAGQRITFEEDAYSRGHDDSGRTFITDLSVASVDDQGQPFSLEQAQAYPRFYDAAAVAPTVDLDAASSYHLFKANPTAGIGTADVNVLKNNDEAPWGFLRRDRSVGTYTPFTTFDANNGNVKGDDKTAWYTDVEYCFVSVEGNTHPTNSASPVISFTAPATGIYYGTMTVWRDKEKQYDNGLVMRSCYLGPNLVDVGEKAYGMVSDGANGQKPETLDFFIRVKQGDSFTFEIGDSQSAGRTHITDLGVATCHADGSPFTLEEAKAYPRFYDAVGEEEEAGVELPATLTFPDYNDSSVGSYTDEWTATVDGAVWTLDGFNNNNNVWEYVKCGRKKNDHTATLLTPAVKEATEMIVTVDKTSNISEVTIQAQDAENTYTAMDITSDWKQGEVSIDLTALDGYSNSALQYLLTIESTAASANGTTQISKVVLQGASTEPSGPTFQVTSTDVNISREAGQGSTPQTENYDFTEAKQFLGVDELKAYMFDIIKPDNVVELDYAQYGGWFDANGNPTTEADLGDNPGVCVKFNDALNGGAYTISDKNCEAGQTINLKWELQSNMKAYHFNFHITFTAPIPTYTSCDAANRAATTTDQKVRLTVTDALVTYVNGKNTYIQDATGGFLIYSEEKFNAGEKFSGTFVGGTLCLHKGTPELKDVEIRENLSVTSRQNPVEPIEVDAAELAREPIKYVSQYVKVKPAKFAADVLSSKSANFTVGETSLILYDQFAVAPTFNKEADFTVAGLVTIYKTNTSTNTELYPTKADDVAEIEAAPLGANLDFEAGEPITDGICTYAKDMAGNNVMHYGMQAVEGWTIAMNPSDNVAHSADEPTDQKAAGVAKYGSNVWFGKNTYKMPATGPEGSNGQQALGIISVWGGDNAIAQYTQDVTLPAGNYIITLPIYNANSAGTKALKQNMIGFIANDGAKYVATTTNYPVGQWYTETISFTLTEETSGKLSIGIQSDNYGSGNAECLIIDRMDITVVTEADLARAELQAAIDAAQATLDGETRKGENLFQISDATFNAYQQAVNEQQGVADNANATADELRAAKQALDAATQAYTANAPEAGMSYVIKNRDAEVYLSFVSTDAYVRTSAEPQEFTWVAADNGGYYLTDGTHYLAINHAWNISMEEQYKAAITPEAVTLDDGTFYLLRESKGVIGIDDLTPGAKAYANKAASNHGYWAIIKNDPRELLASAIAQATAAAAATGEIFQHTDAAGETLKQAVSAAQSVHDNASATKAEIDQATATLNAQIEAFDNSDFVRPDENTQYNVQLKGTQLFMNTTIQGTNTDTNQGLIQTEGDVFTFEPAGNDTYYLKLAGSGMYLGLANSAKPWRMHADAEKKEALTITYSYAGGGYNFQTSQGYIGTDDAVAGGSFYSNKDKGASLWLINEIKQATTYTKVKSMAGLIAGEKYLMVNEQAAVALGAISTTSTKYGTKVGVNIENNQITINDEAVDVLTLSGDADGWSFASSLADGYLNWTGSNSLTLAAEANAGAKWTITFDADGNATIANVGTPARILSYNADSPRFAAYGNMNQKRVQLYKAGEPVDEPVVNAPAITPATGNYTSAQRVTITADQGATIFYTINDGEEQEYTRPFNVSETSVIVAYAKVGNTVSESTTVTINIQNTGDSPLFVFEQADDPTFSVAGNRDITNDDNTSNVINVDGDEIANGIVVAYDNVVTENEEAYLTGFRATATVQDSKGNVYTVKTRSNEDNVLHVAEGLFGPNEQYEVSIQPIIYYNYNQFCDGIYDLWQEGLKLENKDVEPYASLGVWEADENDPQSFHVNKEKWNLRVAAQIWSQQLKDNNTIPYIGDAFIFEDCDPMPYYVDNTAHTFVIKTGPNVVANVKALIAQDFKAVDAWGNDFTAEFLSAHAGDVATGINSLKGAADQTIYNMAGQRVAKAVKGLYIKGGRKVVVK